MKKIIVMALFAFCASNAFAQIGGIKINKKVIDAGTKAVQALTVTDAEIAAYCQEYIDWMDAHNPVCSVTDSDPGMRAFAERLDRILDGQYVEKGVKLDIKVYYVVEQNAFACANGSIRVFAGLMEVMSDDEILGVVGHEIGHIINTDLKDAFKQALLTSALKDAVASTSGKVAKLTDSQLGQLGEALAGAQFSQKQEYAADEYGFNFLKKRGKDPQAMASALRVIEGLYNSDTNVVNALFSSHPNSGKRAERLEKMK